jgi:Fe-S cluster biogenesis protein NfuA
VEAAPAAAEAPSKKKGRGGKKKAAEPVAEAAPEAALPPQVEAAPVSADDVVGQAISMEELQAYIDEYVRPALQSDGGDMTLVKVEGDVVYVQLVGACKTCPSSTLTLRMGVENTLKEEFPQIRELVQVD